MIVDKDRRLRHSGCLHGITQGRAIMPAASSRSPWLSISFRLFGVLVGSIGMMVLVVGRLVISPVREPLG